ncbi:MAG: hypothetical protein ACI8P2_001270, partial [Candidatus Latescibacterota bacterium]
SCDGTLLDNLLQISADKGRRFCVHRYCAQASAGPAWFLAICRRT